MISAVDPDCIVWGGNSNSELGQSTSIAPPTCASYIRDYITPFQAAISPYSTSFSVIVDTAGRIFSSGDNLYGQLGRVSDSLNMVYEQVGTLGMQPITKVAAGRAHTIALTQSGMVYAFGRNNAGQLATGDTDTGDKPEPVYAELSGVVTDVAAGYGHSAFIIEGQVQTVGGNDNGQLGDGTTSPALNCLVARLPHGSTHAEVPFVVEAYGGHTVVLTTAGGVLSTGPWAIETPGPVTRVLHRLPFPVKEYVDLAIGSGGVLALTADGDIWGWGPNANYELLTGDPVPVYNAQRVTLNAGVAHGMAMGYSFTIVAVTTAEGTHRLEGAGLGVADRLGKFYPSTAPYQSSLAPLVADHGADVGRVASVTSGGESTLVITGDCPVNGTEPCGCGPGKYLVRGACRLAPPGYVQPHSGNVRYPDLVPCGVDQYQAAPGQTACLPATRVCPAGSVYIAFDDHAHSQSCVALAMSALIVGAPPPLAPLYLLHRFRTLAMVGGRVTQIRSGYGDLFLLIWPTRTVPAGELTIALTPLAPPGAPALDDEVLTIEIQDETDLTAAAFRAIVGGEARVFIPTPLCPETVPGVGSPRAIDDTSLVRLGGAGAGAVIKPLYCRYAPEALTRDLLGKVGFTFEGLGDVRGDAIETVKLCIKAGGPWEFTDSTGWRVMFSHPATTINFPGIEDNADGMCTTFTLLYQDFIDKKGRPTPTPMADAGPTLVISGASSTEVTLLLGYIPVTSTVLQVTRPAAPAPLALAIRWARVVAIVAIVVGPVLVLGVLAAALLLGCVTVTGLVKQGDRQGYVSLAASGSAI